MRAGRVRWWGAAASGLALFAWTITAGGGVAAAAGGPHQGAGGVAAGRTAGGSPGKLPSRPVTPGDAHRHGTGDDPLAAEQWFVNQRKSSGVTSPFAYAAAEHAAVQQAQQDRSVRPAVVAGAANPIWQPLGPAPLNNPDPSYSNSLTLPAQDNTGRIISIATVGSGSTERLLVGSAGGGVWSATANGPATSWSPLTDFQASLSSGAVAVAPSNNQIIYAGTGEDDQGGDSFYGQGILASTNGGANWTDDDPSPLSGYTISGIAVDPSNPADIYVASSDGFYTSSDSGYTLAGTPIGLNTNASAVAVDPANFNTLFVAVPGTGIEESTNGGTSFSTLTVGTLTGSSFGNTALAISPNFATDGTIYAEIAAPAGSGGGVQVYKSVDGGSTWANTGAPDVTGQAFYYGSGTSDQGFYDLGIAIDPLNTSVVYVAGIGLSMTSNGGSTWTGSGNSCLHSSTGCSLGDFGIHPDFHSLVFDSAGNLFLGNDGGIYELPAADVPTGDAGTDGSNYVDLDNNLADLQFYPGVSQTGDATAVLAGAQDNGTALYVGSEPWNEVTGGDGGFTAIDPGNTAIQYATADQTLYGTTDTWSSSSLLSPSVVSANFVAPFAIAGSATSQSSLTLYYGGERPYKSTDGGASWTALTGSYVPTTCALNGASGPQSDCNDVSAIAVAPNDPSVVYCGWGDGTLQVSTNAGSTWTTITPSSLEGGTHGDHWITHIAVDPANDAHVVVTFSGFTFPQSSESQPHVVETADALVSTPTWTDDTGTGLLGAPTNSAIFDGSTLIVATDVGVYSGVPNGASTSWSLLGSNLPLVQVEDLSLSADGTTLIAVTHGRGAWKLTLPSAGHELLISELRFSGPNGPGDCYVDLYNTAPTTVSLAGWTLHWETSSGTDTSITLPGNGSIAPHGHYLITGGSYSLTVAPDDPSAFSPPSSNTGVYVESPSGVISDAAGLAGAAPSYMEGSALPDSSAVSNTADQYAYARAESAGAPVDTGDNASDFLLLSPGGPATLAGAAWGAPDPQDQSTPLENNGLASSTLIDPTATADAAPNQSYNPSTSTLTIDRTITNTSTNVTITALDLRISALSVQGGPGPNPHAWLQAESSNAGSVPTNCCGTVSTQAVSIVDASQLTYNGDGGIDTVLQVTLPNGGLAPGASVSVQFTFYVAQTGSFWFGYDALVSP